MFSVSTLCVLTIALLCFSACSDDKARDVLPSDDDDITGFAVSTDGFLFHGHAAMVCADGYQQAPADTSLSTWVFERNLTYNYRDGSYKSVKDGSGLVFSGKTLGDITAEEVCYSPDSTLMYGTATYYLPESLAASSQTASAKVNFHAELKADLQPEVIVYEFKHPIHGATTINFYVVNPTPPSQINQ